MTAMTADLYDILQAAGFTPDEHDENTAGFTAFDRGPVRVVVEDGEVTVYRSTDTPARTLRWSARFSPATPLPVVTAALTAAGVPPVEAVVHRHPTVPARDLAVGTVVIHWGRTGPPERRAIVAVHHGDRVTHYRLEGGETVFTLAPDHPVQVAGDAA